MRGIYLIKFGGKKGKIGSTEYISGDVAVILVESEEATAWDGGGTSVCVLCTYDAALGYPPPPSLNFLCFQLLLSFE